MKNNWPNQAHNLSIVTLRQLQILKPLPILPRPRSNQLHRRCHKHTPGTYLWDNSVQKFAHHGVLHRKELPVQPRQRRLKLLVERRARRTKKRTKEAMLLVELMPELWQSRRDLKKGKIKSKERKRRMEGLKKRCSSKIQMILAPINLATWNLIDLRVIQMTEARLNALMSAIWASVWPERK